MTTVIDESYSCEECCVCHVKYWIPTSLQEVAKVRCEEMEFWCPNGHSQTYQREKAGEGQKGEVVTFPRLVT